MARKTTTKYTQTVTETTTSINNNAAFDNMQFNFPHEELNAYNPAKPATYLVQIPTDIHSNTVAVDNKITVGQSNAKRLHISAASIDYQDTIFNSDSLDSEFFILRAIANYGTMFDAINAYERNVAIQKPNSPFGMYGMINRQDMPNLFKNRTDFATPILMRPQADSPHSVDVITDPYKCPKICHDVRITLPKDFTVEKGYTLDFIAKVLAHAHLNDFLLCSSDGPRRVVKVFVIPQSTNYRHVEEYNYNTSPVDYLDVYVIYERKVTPNTDSRIPTDFHQIDLAWGGSFVAAYSSSEHDSEDKCSGAVYVIKEKVMVSYSNSLQAVTVSLNNVNS